MIKVIKDLIPKSQFYLALSGGQDSLAVCHFLKRKGFNFKAAHLNHKMIKQDDECAEKVEEFCSKLGVELVLGVSDLHFDSKRSTEAFARDCRASFFTSLGGDFVLGHHLSDCCTSFLWNCLRGHPDYIPIPEKSKFKNYTVWRPFLLSKKEVFTDYIKKHNLEEFITEDELNKDLTLNRNWIREVLVKEVNSRNYNLSTTVKKIVLKKLSERGYNV